ncbi:MAG: Clp protease N-terminal domain-containing protein [Armatimonadota bacterium]|nr:hypothetical protein [Armatimonadota bacterium]MDW8142255.1 Clp protease N-terminal domain-containing protein [Armatimonadota bacterium]
MQWERFSEQALKALLRAKEWAINLNAQQISPEHLLLGLIEDRETVASRLLEECGVDLDQLQEQVSIQTATVVEARGSQPSMNPSLQRVLKRAETEAQLIGDEHVDTAHLLLSLLRERTAKATKLLFRQGVRYEEVRRRLYQMRAEESGEMTFITLPESFVIDLTDKVLSDEVRPVQFWQEERNAIKRTLLRREQRNPVLLGDFETAYLLVLQFSYDLQFGSLPEELSGRRIIAVNWAGIWLHRQDPNNTIVELLKEIQRIEPLPLLLVGDLNELRNCENALLKAIHQGYTQAIAVANTETWAEFLRQFPLAATIFTTIRVSEPGETQALEWLEAHRSVFEWFHRVEVMESALLAAVQLARSNFPDRPLLATAKNLLDEACAHARCQVFIPSELRLLENEMEQLQAEMRRLLRTSEREHLSELMERAIALQAQIEAMREQFKATVPQVTVETVQTVVKRH